MASKVMIKSYTNGLKVFLDDSVLFDEILSEVEKTFSESQKFFKGSKIAVSFEGRLLSSEEEKAIVSSMETNGGLKVVYIIGKDSETNESFQKALDHLPTTSEETTVFGKLYCDSIKKGEHITTESGVVILGDIQPGGSIIASGNIVVLGGIYGTAICDVSENQDKYFIAAMDISAEKLKIGDYRFVSKEKSKWVIKPKMQAKIAYVNNDQVSVNTISAESLTSLCEKIKAE